MLQRAILAGAHRRGRGKEIPIQMLEKPISSSGRIWMFRLCGFTSVQSSSPPPKTDESLDHCRKGGITPPSRNAEMVFAGHHHGGSLASYSIGVHRPAIRLAVVDAVHACCTGAVAWYEA